MLNEFLNQNYDNIHISYILDIYLLLNIIHSFIFISFILFKFILSLSINNFNIPGL